LSNLKDESNPELKAKLITEDMTPWDIVTAAPRELANDHKKKEMENSLKENLDARRTDWARVEALKSGPKVGFFTCKGCTSKNTSFY
jgi:hypothetical protein